MTRDMDHLTRLLRAELTAVHQQFCHMLALRQAGEDELLPRVSAVDTEDFKNAMQVIDHMVAAGHAFALPPQSFEPGSDLPGMLRAELRLEQDFARILDGLMVTDPAARARLARAAAPRRAYRTWLAARVAALEPPAAAAPPTAPALAALMAQLVALTEQAMLDAFLLWHRRRRREADDAWRLSGAAMLYLTAIVRRGAADGAVPAPAPIPGARTASILSDALAESFARAGHAAALARAAADEAGDTAMGRLCLRIADDCALIAAMRPGDPFAATFGRSQVFESFTVTRERHLN